MAQRSYRGTGRARLLESPGCPMRGSPMSFLRRKKTEVAPPPPPTPALEEVTAQQFSLKLNYLARSSDGLRLAAAPTLATTLVSVVEPLAMSPVEVVDALRHEYAGASPNAERLHEMQQWIVARGAVAPIGRHALYVLESTDAVDMTVDGLVCALLHGEVLTNGYPDYNAIVGGLASHWDELSGDLIVRAVVGWGGKGRRRHRHERRRSEIVGAPSASTAASKSVRAASTVRSAACEQAAEPGTFVGAGIGSSPIADGPHPAG